MDSRANRPGATAGDGLMGTRAPGTAPAFGRIAVAGAALTLLLAATPAQAHDPLLGEFTCPLCLERFLDVYLWHQPLCLDDHEPGMTPGLYARIYVGPGQYLFTCCPHCGYCNEIAGFHLVCRAEAEVRENPYAEPEPKAKKKGEDQKPDEGENADNQRPYVRLFAAQPLDFATLKVTVARSVDPSAFRYVNAYFPERLDILLRTVPGLSAWERLHLALTGAVACDGSGETQPGLDFRTQAIEAGRRIIAGELPDSVTDNGRLMVRYQVAGMLLTVGRARGDDTLRAEGRRCMEAALKSLAAVPEKAEKNAAALHGLRDRIRRRAAEIGLEASAVPHWPENIDSKDAKIAALVEEIRLLFTRTWMPMSGQVGLDAWMHEGSKNLAADAVAGLPVVKALDAVRDGSPVEREAFLMLHGWRWREPPVREFVRDLLLPISPVHGRDTDYRTLLQSNAFADLFGGRQEEVDEAEAAAARQFDRYVRAIRQSYNPSNSTFTFRDLVMHLIPETFECRLPKPPDMAVPGGEAGQAHERSASGRDSDGTIAVRMSPDNADVIRRCLAALPDAATPKADLFAPARRIDLFGPSPDPAVQILDTLCHVDTPWLARLLFDDRSRRPNLYLWAYGCGGFAEVPVLHGEWPRISPDRLIAKHLPNQVRQAAREALDRLAQEKATPQQSAAALTPLVWLEDAESLDTLRRAAEHSNTLVRRVAVHTLRVRGDVPPLRLWLAQKGCEDRIPADWPGRISSLNAKDVRALRKALPAARNKLQKAESADDAYDRDRAEEELGWILAALGHLGNTKALPEYNAIAFRVRAQAGDPMGDLFEDGEKGDYDKMFHTPLTVRYADLRRMLWLARYVYCTEAMADELLDGMRFLPHWYWEDDAGLLVALAANPRTHDRYRRLAANLAPRPVTLDVKRELLSRAADIRVPQVTQAVRRWARSGDPELAHDAREVLRRLERQP